VSEYETALDRAQPHDLVQPGARIEPSPHNYLCTVFPRGQASLLDIASDLAFPSSVSPLGVDYDWCKTTLASVPSMTGWTSGQLGAGIIIVGVGAVSPLACSGLLTGASIDWQGVSLYASLNAISAFPLATTRVEPHEALVDLAEWTSLPTARLGDLLGVARRSLYNWMAGKPVRPEIQARLARVRDAFEPLGEQIEPNGVRAWLDEGTPTNFELIAQQQWTTFERRAQALLERQRVRRIDETADTSGGEVEAFDDSVRAAVFEQFSRSSAGQTRRPDWAPRELTGLAVQDEDDW